MTAPRRRYERVISVLNTACLFFAGGVLARLWWEDRMCTWEFFALGLAIVGVSATEFMRGRISMRKEIEDAR